MDERQQSEFNDAIGYLNRLNSLFYLCDNSSIELDAFSWFHSLMALERELSTEMEEKELSAFETLRASINSLISQYLREKQRSPNAGVSHELYGALHSFELKLRSIYKDSGLQNKMKEDASFALK